MRSFDKLNSFLRNLNMPFSLIGVTETWLNDWGISSSGRAPALHAGGTGIDTRILQLVRLIFCLFFGKILPCKVLTKHLFCKPQHLVI